MISKFLDPKNDVAFKKIFGTEKNKDILIHFLNDMLIFKEHQPIVDVTFLKTIQDPDIAVLKSSIVDILCKDQVGNYYIVEMQVAQEKGFEKRAQYYASKAYVAQAPVGAVYHELKEIIFFAIADFTMFPNKKAYKSDHVILDKHTHENDLKDFSFTFLELSKFNKKIHELESMTDKWAYFFKHAEDTFPKDLNQIIGQDQIIERAFDELDRFSWSEEEMRTYDQAEKYRGAYFAAMAQKLDEGEKLGIKKGEKLGIKKGEKLGIKKGEKLGIKKGEKLGIEKEFSETVNNCLRLGFTISQICEITGRSEKEIKAFWKNTTV